jgi:hypothetical protein
VSASAVARWFPATAEAQPVRFGCVLSEQPRHTVPQALVRGLSRPAGDDAPAPLTIGDAAELLGAEGLAPGRVAVVDSGVRGPLPYWLDTSTESLVAALLDGRMAPSELPDAWRGPMTAAGLVRSPTGARPDLERDEVLAAAAESLAGNGYAALPGVLHPFHLGELRLHVRRLVRLGHMQNGDGQSPQRWVRHNDAALRIFHDGLTGLVSAVAGEPVKPSYVYTAVYHDGAELPRHSDRPQCAYTLSVCLDCLPDPAREVPWPLELHPPRTRVSVYQALGDGLLFKGVEVPHSRPPLARGLTVAAAFMHYVPEAFDGALR